MDTRLLLSTFALIFLAELGDKTQLAALAKAASHDAPWSVFLGAAAALLASTVLAVVFGTALQRVAPPHVVKAAAGLLFVFFGVIFLVSAFRARAAAAAEATAPVGVPQGLVAALTFETALAFEEASAARYAEMARAETDAELRAVWEWLAQEEARHVQEVRALCRKHGQAAPAAASEAPVPGLPAQSLSKARDRLAQAVGSERITADFYDALANVSHLPSRKEALRALSRDERAHAEKMDAVARGEIG